MNINHQITNHEGQPVWGHLTNYEVCMTRFITHADGGWTLWLFDSVLAYWLKDNVLLVNEHFKRPADSIQFYERAKYHLWVDDPDVKPSWRGHPVFVIVVPLDTIPTEDEIRLLLATKGHVLEKT